MKKVILGVMVMCAVVFNANSVKGEGNMISEGKKVKFNYVLTVEGKVFDSSEGKAPLEYTHGQKMIIPGLERKMEGMKAGEKVTVIVGPEDAYGPIDPRAIIEIPKQQLGGDITPQIGMMLQFTNENGQAVPGVIVGVKDDTVVVDFNHPLAGKELKFDVEVIEVN